MGIRSYFALRQPQTSRKRRGGQGALGKLLRSYGFEKNPRRNTLSSLRFCWLIYVKVNSRRKIRRLRVLLATFSQTFGGSSFYGNEQCNTLTSLRFYLIATENSRAVTGRHTSFRRQFSALTDQTVSDTIRKPKGKIGCSVEI